MRAIVVLFSLGLSILGISCTRTGAPSPAQNTAAATPQVVTNSTGLTMVLVPAGEFIMGDKNGDADEQPPHPVKVSRFFMDTHEVTQKAYESLMDKNPSKSKGPDKPVEQVDWYHAVLYCNMRSRKEGLQPCYDPKTLACDFAADGFRLPTEAEWEYACRAGTTGPYWFGNDASKLKTSAWFKDNSDQATHPVGQKPPNPWGLYDICGNVAEWCQDFYSETYYPQSDRQDPHGPPSGNKCVVRGGGCRSNADACRSSARNSETPRFADACFGSDTLGFRCVRRAK